MTGHQDRLAGVVVLSAVLTGCRSVVVRGLGGRTLADAAGSAVELTDSSAGGCSAVVVAKDAADVAAHLAALDNPDGAARPGLVWVLWDGHRGSQVRLAAARLGLAPIATFGYVGTAGSPTHLVRLGRDQALRWFATAARPRWGRRSRLARLGNHLPAIGHHFLDGGAVLLARVGHSEFPWPGAEFASPTGAAVPAVLHLGGGATAGRLVLTWADGAGFPTHHTKLAPEHLADDVVAEAKALAVLAGLPTVSGTVPRLLGLRHGTGWAALSASHLAGRPAPTTPVRAAGRRALGKTPIDRSEVDDAVVTWLAELSAASRGPAGARFGGSHEAAVGAVGRAAASLDDPALRAVVRVGLELGSAHAGLLHGDLWPGNVHTSRAAGDEPLSIAVLDWESALVGHPLVDLLTWLVTSSALGGALPHHARAVLSGEASDDHGGRARRTVSVLLASLGQPLEPAEVEALVLAQMVVVAVAGGPAGGDGTHERAWLDAVREVWASWQEAGRSPWSPVREVSR